MWRRLGSAAALICLGATSIGAAPAAQSVTVQEKGVLALKGSIEPVWLTWRKRPTAAQLQMAYPSDTSGNVYVNLMCARLKHGALEGCRVLEADPDTAVVRRMGLSLAKTYRVAPNAGDASPSSVAWVGLYMNLSAGGPSMGKALPCLPPFCLAETLTPPPPPPKPPASPRELP